MCLLLTNCTNINHSRPTTWTRYQAASLVIKTVSSGFPRKLKENLMANSYIERRKPKRLKFFDASKTRIGRQPIENRIGTILNNVEFDWTDGISNDAIRRNLKKHFNMNALHKWIWLLTEILLTINDILFNFIYLCLPVSYQAIS